MSIPFCSLPRNTKPLLKGPNEEPSSIRNQILGTSCAWMGYARVLDAAKQLAWTLPIAVAFTDLVACVVKVEGPSMQVGGANITLQSLRERGPASD